jgi:hypothetical protein
MYMDEDCEMARMLDRHLAAMPSFLALNKAGRRMEINRAMIAITTKSSINVKPATFERLKWRCGCSFSIMARLPLVAV